MGTSSKKPDGRKTEADSHPQDYYEQLINSLASGIITVDREGIVRVINTAARAHLQATEEDLSPGDRIHDVPGVAPFADIMREVLEAKGPVTRRELILTDKSGTKREVGLSASLLEGPGGAHGVIFLFTDMTERRNLERAAELNRQLAQLGELTAGVVHELRNPLTVISGSAELLMRRFEPDDKRRRNAEIIFEEAAHMEKAVAQFLGFARPFDIEAALCNPENIVERVLQLCAPRAEKKGVSVRHSVEEELPAMRADMGKAAQAVVNIVNNAIDAVDAGTGEVVLEVFRDGPVMVFAVSDNGPGIRLEAGEDLFKPFFSKKESGTGLGLAIAQRIVTAHSGSIRYENVDEGGTRFEVRLPIEKGSLW